MNDHPLSFRIPVLPFARASALSLALLAAPGLHAATYYWDTNDSTAGFGTAGGTWAAPTTNNATQGWSTSSAGTNTLSGTTTTTTSDTLYFGTASSPLAAGTVNVSGTVSANQIYIYSPITLSGGTIAKAFNTSYFIYSPGVVIDSYVNSAYGHFQGNQSVELSGDFNASGVIWAELGSNVITVSGNVITAANPAVYGGGIIAFTNDSNAFTHSPTVTQSSKIQFTSIANIGVNSSLGSGSSIIFGTNQNGTPTFENIGSGGTSNRSITLTESSFSTTKTISNNGTGALNLSGAVTSNAASGITTTLGLDGSYAGENTISSALGDGAGGGTLAVTKSGSTTWVLSGANTFTGATTVAAGVLRAAHSNALGGTAGSTTVSSGAALELSGGISIGAEALALSGTGISSGGGLRNISGTNSYAGLITLGATSSINSDAGTLTLSGGITGAQSLTFAGAGDTTLSGNITTSTGAITKGGAGTLTLAGAGNSWNGTTNINSGTITLSGNLTTTGTVQTGWSAAGGVLNITGNLTRTGGNVRSFVIAGGANYNGTVNVSGSGVLNMGAGALIGEDWGGHGVFNQSGGTVNTQGDVWMTGQTSTLNVSGGSFNMGSSQCRLGAGATYGSNSTITVNGSGTITMGILSFGVASRNATAMTVNLGDGSPGGNLSITGMSYGAGASSGASTINFNGGTLNVRSTTSMITQATTVVKSGGAILDVDSGQTFTIGTALTDGGGGGGLTKNGTGTLTLSGSNAYTGTTTINAGTLTLSGGSAIVDTGAVSVSSGAVLNLSSSETIGSIAGDGNVTLGSNTLTAGGANTSTTFSGNISGTGGLTKAGSGTLTLDSFNSYSGATTITAGTLQITGSGQLGGGSYAGNIVMAGAFTYNSTADQTLSGQISGGGSLNKFASSTLTLSGSNTRSGNLAMGVHVGNLTAGAVKLEHNNALGTGLVVWENDGTVELAADGLTVANANGIYNRNSATDGKRRYRLDLAGSNTGTFSGNFDIRMSGLVFDVGTDDTLTASGTLFSGAGAGNLEKTGAGTLVLTGNNSYSLGTTLNSGTLVIGHANATGTGTITQADGTSLLKLDTTGTIANNMSIYNVASNQSVTLTGSITAQNTTYDVASGTTLSINGSIGGAGGVTKDGDGTLELNAANTFTGDTVVNAGTLEANASGALASTTNITVNGGSLLVGASNAINDSAAMDLAGGSLKFSGTVTDTIGALTLSANSVIDLGTGSVTAIFADLFMGTYTLAVHNWTGTTLWDGGTGNNTDKIYFNRNLSSGELDRISFYSDFGSSFLGTGFQLGLGSGFQYEVIPVPEPETWATAAILLIGGGVWMCRRKRQTPARA